MQCWGAALGVSGHSHERLHPVDLEVQVAATTKTDEAVEVLEDFCRAVEGRHENVRYYDILGLHFENHTATIVWKNTEG